MHTAIQHDRPTINLALQGGGSHGAFTWGVLDALLEDGRVNVEGVSGTSAGAMNAVAMVHGFAQAAGKSPPEMREAARASLARFWDGVVGLGAVGTTLTRLQRLPFELLFGGLGGGNAAVDRMADALSGFWGQWLSPYQSNPMDINPLRSFLERQIDFERLAQCRSHKVFVVATAVSTGKAEVFYGRRLTADAVMASACLPTLFQAVEIGGEHYWDGGFSGNPAFHPLIYRCDSRDIVLVQINPIKREKLPTSAAEIMDRINEITFNGALIAEMRAIDFVKRLLAEGRLDPARYKDVLMHRIDGGETLEGFQASTKSSIDAVLIRKLKDLGSDSAKRWLAVHFGDLGKVSSIRIARDYLDDLRVPAR